jgi:hypothetical protein
MRGGWLDVELQQGAVHRFGIRALVAAKIGCAHVRDRVILQQVSGCGLQCLLRSARDRLPPMAEALRRRWEAEFKRQVESPTVKVALQYAAEDQVWAEWIEKRWRRGTLSAQANLAVSLRSAGRPHEAVDLLDQAYERLRRRFGDDSPYTLACRLNRAVNLLALNRVAEATTDLRGSVLPSRPGEHSRQNLTAPKCPARGTSSTSAPWILVKSRCVWSAGENWSAQPCHNFVGARIDARSKPQCWRAARRSSTQPLGPCRNASW